MPRPLARRTRTMWFKLGLWLLLVAALLLPWAAQGLARLIG
jgi:hypothetical protein